MKTPETQTLLSEMRVIDIIFLAWVDLRNSEPIRDHERQFNFIEPVDNGLPEGMVDVLMYDPFQNEMITGWYIAKDNRWVSGLSAPEDYFEITVYPTHWMPLPNPPQQMTPIKST